jgi:hypothetical protein
LAVYWLKRWLWCWLEASLPTTYKALFDFNQAANIPQSYLNHTSIKPQSNRNQTAIKPQSKCDYGQAYCHKVIITIPNMIS